MCHPNKILPTVQTKVFNLHFFHNKNIFVLQYSMHCNVEFKRLIFPPSISKRISKVNGRSAKLLKSGIILALKFPLVEVHHPIFMKKNYGRQAMWLWEAFKKGCPGKPNNYGAIRRRMKSGKKSFPLRNWVLFLPFLHADRPGMWALIICCEILELY